MALALTLAGCKAMDHTKTKAQEDPGKVAEARQTLAQMITVNDQVAGDMYQQGLAAEEMGDIQGAENAYLRALKLRPSFTPMIHAQLGLLHHQRGHLDLAEEYLKLAAESDKGSALLRYQLALVHADRGDKPKAMDSLRQALSLNPDFYDAKIMLAELGGIRQTLPAQKGPAKTSP